MSFSIKIQKIVFQTIFKQKDIQNWSDYKNSILLGLLCINFNRSIENYTFTGKILYVQRSRLKKLVYDTIMLNTNLFKEVKNKNYEPRERYFEISKKDVLDTVEKCVDILVEKQTLSPIKSIDILHESIRNKLYSQIKKSYDDFTVLNEYKLEEGLFIHMKNNLNYGKNHCENYFHDHVKTGKKIIGIVPINSDSIYSANGFKVMDFTEDSRHFIHTHIIDTDTCSFTNKTINAILTIDKP